MDLKTLIKAGAIAPGFEAAKTVSVTWDGNTFDVKVKTDMSAADFEWIYQNRVKDEDDSIMARRIHRFVLLADSNERIPYEEARKLKPTLCVALCGAINKVHGEDPERFVKKTSRQRKSSGTS